MGLPIAIGVALAGSSIASSIFGASQSYKAAKSQAARLRKQYESARRQSLYKAQISDFNAMLIDRRKSELKQEEGIALLNNLKQSKQLEGSQKLAMAASGVSLGSGSSGEILKTTRWQNSLEADAIRESYSKGRWNFGIQANQAREEAMMHRRAASTFDNVDLGVSSTPYVAQALQGIAQTGMNVATLYG